MALRANPKTPAPPPPHVDLKSFLSARRKRRPAVSYQVGGINYRALSPEDRREQEEAFHSLLRSLDAPVEMTRAPQGGVLYDGTEYSQYMVYFTSTQDLEAPLRAAGYSPVRLDRPFAHHVKREYMDHLELEDGSRMRVYNVYGLRHDLNETAWTVRLPVHETVTRIAPMDPARARGELTKFINVGASRMADPTVGADVREAAELRTAIMNDETGMVETSIHAMQFGLDAAGLREECRAMERACRLRQLRLTTVRGLQRRLLAGWGSRFIFERAAAALALFPFDSSDLVEPGGVILGTNTVTGAPVVYDYTRRVNSNVTFVGESGKGKSTAAKTYLDNFLSRAPPEAMVTIIDPHGEYAGLAGRFGCEVRDLADRDRMGLDPFKILEHPSKAVGLLAECTGMGPAERSVAVSLCDGAGSVAEMRRTLENSAYQPEMSRRAAAFLAQFVSGDVSGMFAGDPAPPRRVIYTMRGEDKTRLNAMLVSLVMARAWRSMREADVRIPKLFVIDEGWFVTSMDESGAILFDMARSGRKENVHLLFLTQEPDDLLGNPHGKAVLMNSDTTFLMGLKPALADQLQGVLHLSDAEKRDVERLGLGDAILRAGHNRIFMHCTPTAEQMAAFTTKPGE